MSKEIKTVDDLPNGIKFITAGIAACIAEVIMKNYEELYIS